MAANANLQLQAQPARTVLTNLEEQVLRGFLDQSNSLVHRIAGIHDERNWGEREEHVTAKFFRAINEEGGKKRLFVCCNGTWKNASGTAKLLTNVARFARAVDRYGIHTEFSASAITQVIYYSGGVRDTVRAGG
ncbi:hypothetical protein G647_00992 [Cladophialophora carrionii CBS 160.54]|uniref:T6SS Phospholipase effector Tle1-like catalytic domain-containing protein n=1 Tax=Cladophialophora carrionii CBS 160.54 TaxID=1279043 RepID=V9DRG4_9EURO|nr:uncharacterized protein G647_00992 [Cladophialophora carrionii CBS 160.54]ETI28542.1 hypothetical protein G647_00992 [Cladophialophora carrionii CBS 160.54]